ncbi:hypothetical protein U1Q18_039931 [Sarracenia purpurea var. burkii]
MLQTAILGANDGLPSLTALMLGVGVAKEEINIPQILSGLARAFAGARGMAIGEFVSGNPKGYWKGNIWQF